MRGEQGSLFKAGSVTSCTQAIETAISQPEKLAAMAQKAQNNVKTNYDWSKITTHNLSVYSQTLKSDKTEKTVNSTVRNSKVNSLQEKVTQS